MDDKHTENNKFICIKFENSHLDSEQFRDRQSIRLAPYTPHTCMRMPVMRIRDQQVLVQVPSPSCVYGKNQCTWL